jgi:hypothetical protein
MYTLDDIFVYIFNWHKVNQNSLLLYEKIIPIIKNTCIINCDENLILNKSIKHIQLDDSCYYGSQYNYAINNVESNCIFCVIAGDNNVSPDYHIFFNSALKAFNNYNAGVFGPNDKRAPHHNEIIRHVEDSYYEIKNTDCGFWFIHPSIVEKLKNIDYCSNKYGWGIDVITTFEARKQGFSVIRDYSIETDQLDHNTNYDGEEAMNLCNEFVNNYMLLHNSDVTLNP